MKTTIPALALAASLATGAAGFDNGGWGDVPPQVRAWFKSVKAPNGIPCCDIADGHGTDEELRADGTTWIPNPLNEAVWMQVPPESIVYEAGNPTGRAVVWWVRQGADTVYIRCFVHGGGV